MHQAFIGIYHALCARGPAKPAGIMRAAVQQWVRTSIRKGEKSARAKNKYTAGGPLRRAAGGWQHAVRGGRPLVDPAAERVAARRMG